MNIMVIIPVSRSEDQDLSQLTSHLRVSPVGCVLQIQGLPPTTH